MLELPKIVEARGNLSYLEEASHVPFEIRRVSWVHERAQSGSRGRAPQRAEELIVALSGSFDVVTHDGSVESVHRLNRPYLALHLPPLHWREIRDASANVLALVVASEHDGSDEIVDFMTFLALHRS